MLKSLFIIAAKNCIDTATFGEVCDDCHGSAIMQILTSVAAYMAGAVVILAVLGVIVAGYMYMTSAGNPTTQAKAKARISQIAIGLVLFSLMNVLIQFLLPSGLLNPTSGGECPEKPIHTDPAYPTTPTNPTTPTTPSDPSTPTTPTDDPTTPTDDPTPTASTDAELLAKTAVMMAWPYESGANAGKCRNSSGQLVSYKNSSSSPCKAVLKETNAAMVKQVRGKTGSSAVNRAQDCSHFVSDLIAYTGVDISYGDRNSAGAWDYLVGQGKKSDGKWEEIPNKGSTKNLKPGDVFVYPRKNGKAGHVMIYVGSYGYEGNAVGASLNNWVARTHNIYYTHADNGAGTKFKIFRLKE